jgi:hypothetical protein
MSLSSVRSFVRRNSWRLALVCPWQVFCDSVYGAEKTFGRGAGRWLYLGVHLGIGLGRGLCLFEESFEPGVG